MINTSANVVASNPVTTVTSTTLAGAAPATIRYRNASSSLSSSDEDLKRPEVSRKSRAGEKLAAAVGQFLLKHPNAYGAQPGPAQVEAVVTTQGGQVVGEQIKSNTDATTTAALLAVAQNLLQSKYKAHKHSKYDDQVGVAAEPASKFYKNKALIQSTALTVLPFVREQIKTLSGGRDITVDANGNPKLDAQTIKAIAAVTKKMIRGHASGTATTGVSSVTTETTTGVKSGLSGRAVAAASIARNFMKKRRSGTKSVSSSSSSSESDSGKGKKVVLLAAGAAIARQLVTRLNRRKVRKEVKAQIAAEKEPSKLEALKAKLAGYRQRSPSSSPDDVETKKKSAALLAAATTVAKKLTEARLLQRKSKLTEEQYNTKLAAVPTKLQRTESASSSDEEVHAASKNKALFTAAKLFVQHQINKVFRRDHAKAVATTTVTTTTAGTTGVTTVAEAEKRRKREAALAAAATLSTRYFLAKSDTHKHHHRSVKGAQTEAIAVSKAAQHRHKSSSSSSGSSSSSDEEGEGQSKRLAAVTALGAGIAKKLVEQLNRKQSRTQLKSQIATEKDEGKLAGLKAKLAAFRSASPDANDSSSSDEESHKKRNLILASATAAAGLLLKQRLDARKQKGLISETVYTEKVAAIPSQLAVGSLASGVVGTGITSTAINTNVTGLTTAPTVLSSDDEVVIGKSRKSLLLPAQQLVNRLVTRNYRKQYPRKYRRHQVYGNPATGVVVEKERPRAWVKAAQGVALSLLRETANRQHYTKGAATTTTGVITSTPVAQTVVEETIVQKPVYTESHTATSVGTGLGVGLATGLAAGAALGTGLSTHSSTAYVAPTTTTSYSTVPTTTSYTTVPATTSYSTTVPTTTAYTTGVTTASLGGRGYEMVDAAVKVKRHGLTNLVYEDLGYFVTLKLDYDYLHSRGILKPGDKLKHLLKVKNQNQFSLDNAVDESTKNIIKQSLGLDPRDNIKLEYTGLPGGAVLSSDSVSSGLEDVYVTPEEARVRNLTTSEKLKNRFSRKNRVPVAYGTAHVSKVDKLKSKLHGHHDDPTYIPGPNTHGVGL